MLFQVLAFLTLVNAQIIILSLLTLVNAQTPWVGSTPPNIVLSYPADVFPHQTKDIEDIPLPLKILSRLSSFPSTAISVASANYTDTTLAMAAASIADISIVLPYLDLRRCMGASSGVFVHDCTTDDMLRDETRIHPLDLTAAATIVLGGGVDSGFAIIRDRTLRTSLGGSCIIVASDWTMLLAVDLEAGVYRSQYIAPKYPGVVKFLSTSLRPCLTVGKTGPNQFNEDHIIDEILLGHGLDVLTAFGVLYALNPDILSSWETDVPFAGASIMLQRDEYGRNARKTVHTAGNSADAFINT
jgi:hypothetical protein